MNCLHLISLKNKYGSGLVGSWVGRRQGKPGSRFLMASNTFNKFLPNELDSEIMNWCIFKHILNYRLNFKQWGCCMVWVISWDRWKFSGSLTLSNKEGI